MPITLPYSFNTHRTTVLALKATLIALAVMLFAGLVMLVGRHDIAGAIGALVVDLLLAAFARILLRAMPGAEGRITRDAVETRATRVWGIALPGPVGTFPVAHFRAVQIERAFATSGQAILRPIERVTLAGMPGMPDVRVFEGHVEGDASPGEALASALALPVEVLREPARIVWRRRGTRNGTPGSV